MWNYSFMVPCSLVMFLLLPFYFTRRRLPTRLNAIFVELVGVEALVIVLDIVSTKMDEYYELFDLTSLYLINTAFFVV